VQGTAKNSKTGIRERDFGSRSYPIKINPGGELQPIDKNRESPYWNGKKGAGEGTGGKLNKKRVDGQSLKRLGNYVLRLLLEVL